MKKSELRKIIRNIIIQEQGPRPSMDKNIYDKVWQAGYNPNDSIYDWIGNPSTPQEMITNYNQFYNSNPNLPNEFPDPNKFASDVQSQGPKAWFWPAIRIIIAGAAYLFTDDSPDDEDVIDDMQVYSPTTAAPMRRGAVMNEQNTKLPSAREIMNKSYKNVDLAGIISSIGPLKPALERYNSNYNNLKRLGYPTAKEIMNSISGGQDGPSAMPPLIAWITLGIALGVGLTFLIWDNSPDDPDVIGP